MSKISSFLHQYIDKSQGVFLLIIAICGNFIAETLNCSLQRQLRENRFLKYLVVFFTIYISIHFTSNKKVNPFLILLNTFMIFSFFILFTRMPLYPTYITIGIFILIFFINNYLVYSNANHLLKLTDKHILITIQKILLLVLITTMIIGNLQYFRKKKTQFGNRFHYLNYLFGNYQCHKSNLPNNNHDDPHYPPLDYAFHHR